MPSRITPAKRARMLSLIVFFGILGVFAPGVSPAHAGKVCFGTQEFLTRIQDVTITGPKGENLYLGYKFSIHCFVFPYTLSDDGYVLGLKGREAYIRLDEASIDRYQATGLLPRPLPAYEISTLDYAMAHLFWAVLVIMAGSVIFAIPRTIRRRRARPYFESALAHGRNGNVNGAIADYTKAIEIAPRFDAALLNRGAIHERRGEYDKAIADFTKTIKVSSGRLRVLAIINRGIIYQKMKDFDRAIEDHTLAITLRGAADAYYNRGNAYMAKGDYPRAVKDYTRAIKMGPPSASAYQARGGAYDRQGDPVRAQADYEAARTVAGRQGAGAATGWTAESHG
jgi:tetratricopeptide (TPR) repeat protein